MLTTARHATALARPFSARTGAFRAVALLMLRTDVNYYHLGAYFSTLASSPARAGAATQPQPQRFLHAHLRQHNELAIDTLPAYAALPV